MANLNFSERRRRQRMGLHWVVRLKRLASEDYVRAETRDLTPEGFYCLSPEPFKPAEVLECMIDLPSSKTSSAHRTLQGRVTVLRVKRVRRNSFGIACRLEDYLLASGAA